MSNRAPSGSAMRSVVPAQRQAAGARAAWSQPFNPSPMRPRCSGDAGPLGRLGGTAARKAGDEGRVRCTGVCFRERASDEILPSRSPRVPPQTMFGPEARLIPVGARPQNRFETARPFEANTAYPPATFPALFRGTSTKRVKATRENPAPIGVPGMALCRRNATAARRAPHKVHAGLPRDAR